MHAPLSGGRGNCEMGKQYKTISQIYLKTSSQKLRQALLLLTWLTIRDGIIKVGIGIWFLKIIWSLPILGTKDAFPALLSFYRYEETKYIYGEVSQVGSGGWGYNYGLPRIFNSETH